MVDVEGAKVNTELLDKLVETGEAVRLGGGVLCLPSHVELTVSRVKDQTFHLRYVETFDSLGPKIGAEVAAVTSKLFNEMLNAMNPTATVKLTEDGVGLVCELDDTREHIASFIAGEFLPWSTLGHRTISDLLFAGFRVGQAKTVDDLKKLVKKKKKAGAKHGKG